MFNKRIIAGFCLMYCSLGFAAQSASVDFAKPTLVTKPSPAVADVDFTANAVASAPATTTAVKPEPVAKKPVDMTAVHSSVAVKDKMPKEILLPGVMRIDGQSNQALDSSKTKVIEFTNGDSPSVYMSITDINRIQLPFSSIKVFSMSLIDIKTSGNNLYVQFKDDVSKPVQLFIENQDNEGGATLGLQLIPKKIPAQTLIVQDNTGLSATNNFKSKSSDYSTNIQAVMETVALGKVPNGYSFVNTRECSGDDRKDAGGCISPILMNGLIVTMSARYSNSNNDVYVYSVVNSTQSPATVTEADFDGKSVRAVSIYPNPNLKPNDMAKVIVISSKPKQISQR